MVPALLFDPPIEPSAHTFAIAEHTDTPGRITRRVRMAVADGRDSNPDYPREVGSPTVRP